jgi:structure-specific endonuclease subunit SLX1
MHKGKKALSPTRKRKRPPMSLEARLKNLHHLLGVESFSRWSLHLTFFAPDVFAQWERHIAKLKTTLRKSITIQLTPAEIPKLASDVSTELQTHFIPEIIRAIPVAYEDCKAYIEKVRDVLENQQQACGVCRKEAVATTSLVLVCPVDLSSHFAPILLIKEVLGGRRQSRCSTAHPRDMSRLPQLDNMGRDDEGAEFTYVRRRRA